MAENLSLWQLNAIPEVRFEGDFQPTHYKDLAKEIVFLEGKEKAEDYIQGVVVAGEKIQGESVQNLDRKNYFGFFIDRFQL